MFIPEVRIVLASFQPKNLAAFYAFAMNAKICMDKFDKSYEVSTSKGLVLQIYRPSSKRSFPIKGRALSLCLRREPSQNPLSEIKKWSSELVNKGAKTIDESRLEIFGGELWMEDPEGNTFLILVPSISTEIERIPLELND